MKRFFSAVVFCTCLLAVFSFYLFPVTRASENPLLTLLNLPAPPPPNPQVALSAHRTPAFFSKSSPPLDDGPIDDLMDYWEAQSTRYQALGYNPVPSDKVIDRLLAEVQKDPEKVHSLLNAFRESKKAGAVVKEIYDRTSAGTEAERSSRGSLKRWLTYNSPYFSAELSRTAARASDSNEYVSHQEELLALGRVDWERARPLVDRLYGGNQKVSRVLAQWALYRNALDGGSSSDIERYRDELKAVVEDKTATDGMRDLAFDALVKEKEWSGRDEWYYSLLSDETLDDLRVGGRTYTGLTTIMYYSPDEKYIDRMLELVKSDNKAVRTAAAKNLLKRLSTGKPEVVKALLPWLEDPKWLNQDDAGRSQIVSALQNIKLLESVPGLIAALDEKGERTVTPRYSANMIANAANSVAYTANQAAVVSNVSGASNVKLSTETYYPLRSSAIDALAFQGDARAVPALRRLLNEADQPHEQNSLIGALFRCGGFTIAEQVDALEYVARNAETLSLPTNAETLSMPTNAMANANFGTMRSPNFSTYNRGGSATGDIKQVLGIYIAGLVEMVNNDLARAVVDRITLLERNDLQTANMMRKIVLRWFGPAVNTMLLRDLKNNKVDVDAVVRLLAFRKELRENQQADVFDLRTGGPTAVGISSCLLEDANDYEAILNGTSDETKTALFACARLIRAPLSVQKVAANLQSKDKLLALAAERYLESEDSPEARRIVLSLHPNEAKILGATTAFHTGSEGRTSTQFLAALMATVSPYHALPQGSYMSFSEPDFGKAEKRLQEEVRQDPQLLGIYSWGDNFIRIYKERAVLSWEQDTARYHERVLTKDEFDNFKGLLVHYKSDDLPPFLSCIREQCETKELLMLGRNGGRRVFVRVASMPPFFAELDKMFESFRQPPSAIKYWAGKDITGLEVLFADDRLDAIAVWKNGSDFRLLTSDKARRDEIDSEIETFAANLPEEAKDEESDYGEDARVGALRSKRQYENFIWSDFSTGAVGSTVSQPSQVEYIPIKDGLAVEPAEGQWKARAGAIEIRADSEGLYKVAAGKVTKIRTGYYGNPVVTPNGRWVVATKYEDESGANLVRVNLLTNKEFIVDSGESSAYRAVAFVPSTNRVMVGPYENEYTFQGREQSEGGDYSTVYSLLDPESGALSPARGEIRPIIQQTHRALQPAANAYEFWAAMPKETETVVGIYNARTFTFKPLLKLPKISFDSMAMWVDSKAGKAYFVYKGHLLAAPIKIGP